MDEKALHASDWDELRDSMTFHEVQRALREFFWRQEYRKKRYNLEKDIMRRAKEEGWLSKKD